MIIHPSVLQLSKRLGLFLPAAGLAAAVAYLLALSHAVYPGYSAFLAAEAVGVGQSSGAAHPLFSLVSHNVASLDVLTLPVRLNLLSAVCGTLCAMLVGLLVGRVILFSACEDPGGGGQTDLDQDEDALSAQEPGVPLEVVVYNRLVQRMAMFGGLAASLLFAFSAPVWSAATRLDNGLFALVLGLSSFCLFPAANERWRDLRLAFSVLFFALGLFESCAFIPLLPGYAFILFRTGFLETEKKLASFVSIVLSGLLGAGCAVLAFRQNVAEASAFTLPSLLQVYARELWAHHLFELRSFFSQQGWLLVLLQIGLPAVILIFGLPTLFKEKKTGTAVVLLLAVASVSPALLNLPISLYQLYRSSGHLPVFGSAVIAAVAAQAFAACLLLVLQENHPEADDQAEATEAEEVHRFQRLRGFEGGLLAAHLLICAAALWRGYGAVDNEQGAFADRVAQAMLREMNGRTCLITNGLLDDHLRIHAYMQGQPLTLIKLSPRPSQSETDDLRELIASSPLFEGLNRLRLQNSLSIGTVRFVMEWLNADVRAAEKAMIFATPDIWTACGFCALPEGLAFGGIRKGSSPDCGGLSERNRTFLEGLALELARPPRGDRFVAGLRTMLQMKAGFAANELGTLMEENGDWEAAFSAYQRATAIDPRNVSAAVNAYELVRTRRLHLESEDALRKKMKQAVDGAHVRGVQDVTWLLQNHGSIRQQAFFLQQTADWSSRGAREVAADKARKALSLTVQVGVSSLIGNAATYLQAGNAKQAEACFAAAQEKDPSNRDALIGLCTLMIGQKRISEAEGWYRKALDAGVDQLALRYQCAMLAVLKNEKDRALKLLEAATREVPSDARYWALLADLYLERGDSLFVERQLLPDMQRALKTTDHYLIHSVNGMVLWNKGPGFYKEARLNLLRALSQNASLTDIWTALLKLDLAVNNIKFTESDVRRLLAIDPDHALGNYLMGTVLLSRGELSSAEDFFYRSIEKNPTSVACNDLAEDLRQQTRLQEAEKYARKALEIEPGLAPAMDTLACVLFDGGRYEEAAALAKKAVAAKPGCMAFQLSLLRSHVRLGDKAAVARLVNELSERDAAVPEALQDEIKAMR